MQAAISGETSIWPRISPTGDSVTYFKLDLGRTETVGVDYRKAVFPPTSSRQTKHDILDFWFIFRNITFGSMSSLTSGMR